MEEIKRIYFVGIKGVGMASLAVIVRQAGLQVQGSDVSEEFITDSVLRDAGIEIDSGFEVRDLSSFVSQDPHKTLVVTTAAHGGLDNPQSVWAREHNIHILTHGQAVGFFMTGTLCNRSFEGISVLGCHGKTTISAMVATALTVAGLDPTYSVGTSELFPLGAGGHLGNGPYFVAEADEFISDIVHDRTVKFLYQHPMFAIINNIDFDHPDVYKDLEDVKKTFFQFVFENIQENGTLFVNGDDPILQELKSQKSKVKIENKKIHVVTYGEGERNDVQIVHFKEVGWGSEFEVNCFGKSLGIFSLQVPGFHNAKNALSVVALLHTLGVRRDLMKKAVHLFQGTKRRQERLGYTKNMADVIDDYAHHPDEIEKTLAAIKSAYPSKKLAVLFQPHTISRTVALQDSFAKAFTRADAIVFLPIFASKREGEAHYEQLYDSIKKSIQEQGVNVEFLPDTRSSEELSYSPYSTAHARASVVKYVEESFSSPEWVVVTLGAGDVYRIGRDLISKTKIH